MNTIECPCCIAAFSKEEGLLGVLGDTVHYRCPYCGSTISHSVDDEQLESDND